MRREGFFLSALSNFVRILSQRFQLKQIISRSRNLGVRMLAVKFRGIDGEIHLIEQIPSDVALRESAYVTTVGPPGCAYGYFAHTAYGL